MSVRVSVRVIKIAPAILFFAGAFHPLLVQTNRTHKMKTNKKKPTKTPYRLAEVNPERDGNGSHTRSQDARVHRRQTQAGAVPRRVDARFQSHR